LLTGKAAMLDTLPYFFGRWTVAVNHLGVWHIGIKVKHRFSFPQVPSPHPHGRGRRFCR
jgi:hypothetical protein